MPTLRESLTYSPTELSFGTSGLRALVADMTDLECYINTRGFIMFAETVQKLEAGATIYIAGDLRESTARILASVHQAIVDSGRAVVFGGYVPTPAISFYGLQNDCASIMVTGSHIPADRNGIKFNKLGGEVLKDDETAIKKCVFQIREEIYDGDAETASFDATGSLKTPSVLPPIDPAIATLYKQRYDLAFAPDVIAGKKIVFYQHSCVGRDLIPEILESLGATVVLVDRTDYFVSIDTENVTIDNQIYFKKLASDHPDAFAIVSTDGDSDRPFVIDENGIFHRGDELGALVASWLKADFAAIPISSSDGVTRYMTDQDIEWQATKIGSPYVIDAMAANPGKTTVGWEVNGGFLLGSEVATPYGRLQPLPTRDAVLPIIIALVAAAKSKQSVSALFEILPKRYTQAGMIDNFPTEISRSIIGQFANDTPETRTTLAEFFTFGDVTSINTLDGIRIFFASGDIAHLRPSGNAPQLRIYSVADSQERADEIVHLAITEPDGIFRTIQNSLAN